MSTVSFGYEVDSSNFEEVSLSTRTDNLNLTQLNSFCKVCFMTNFQFSFRERTQNVELPVRSCEDGT